MRSPQFVGAVLLTLSTFGGAGALEGQQGGAAVAPTIRPIPNGVLGGVPLTPQDSIIRTVLDRLDFENFREMIATLASFGDREQGTEGNARANDWIEEQLRSWGYAPERMPYQYQNSPRDQVYATKLGTTHPGEMYILGAHMDGRGGGQGVNDNASGTALVLEIARVLAASDIQTGRSIRFALWNNEETGLNGARAYVEQRAGLQGIQDPPGSGIIPEPFWLGMIQHDKVLFDRGNPVQPQQVLNADVDIEFQLNSVRWEESSRLAVELINANRVFATDYPAVMSNSMSNTDSTPFMNLVPSVSVRENRRLYEIGRGSDPHWHQPTDVLETYTDLDYRLGFNAIQTTLGATLRLAGVRLVTP